ncbi:MAG: hypothetical protein JXK93_01755 [Sphaerochaetaceae bacterium]|nr:hypothetical protein [Sphaerochaetaceae bacterium]
MKAVKCLHGEDFSLRVGFSLQNIKLDENVLNIPLFMTDWSEQIIDLALQQILYPAV